LLLHRVLTAIVLVPLVLCGLFYLPDALFQWVFLGVFAIGAFEWGNILERIFRNVSFLKWIFVACFSLGALCIQHFSQSFDLDFLLYLGCFWWLVCAALVREYPRKLKFWKQSLPLLFLFGLLTLLPAYFALLELKRFSFTTSGFSGEQFILGLLLITISADTGAYFSGKKWGNRKLMPKVSPNKTLEGFYGGMVMACLVLSAYWLFFGFDLMIGIFVTVITVLASVLGDLSESMFKRHAKVKDSGNLLPGHGGILDRIDSLTAALPVFALLLILFGDK
jgi:phosphatidate cytidylyltransferase